MQSHIRKSGASVPCPPRIGWVLTGDFALASSRLQGYRIHEQLIAQGLDSRILAWNFGVHEKGYSYPFFALTREILHAGLDVVFFQKPGWMMFKMSEILRLNGITTIAIQCDPFPGDYGRYFDATVVTTEELKQQLQVPEAHIIDDMIEVPMEAKKGSYAQVSERLRVVWVGQGTGPGGKRFIEPFIDKMARNPQLSGSVEFVTISRGSWATHEWSLDTVYSLICSCDVAIIPLPEVDWAIAKSSNRLTMLMSLGMPTIVSPIPSYTRILKHKVNGLIASSLTEFMAAIEMCKDENLRSRLGQTARLAVREHFSPEALCPRWIEVIERARQESERLKTANSSTVLMSYLLHVFSKL